MLIELTISGSAVWVSSDSLLYVFDNGSGVYYTAMTYDYKFANTIQIDDDPATLAASLPDVFVNFAHATYTGLYINCSLVDRIAETGSDTKVTLRSGTIYLTELVVSEAVDDVAAKINDVTDLHLCVAYYTMQGNSTTTSIGATSTYYNVEGTTVEQQPREHFSMAGGSNQAEYTGLSPRYMRIDAIATLSASNNDQVAIGIAVNNTVVAESETLMTCDGNNRAENIKAQLITLLNNGDVVSIKTKNNTATNEILVEDLSVIIQTIQP